MKKKLLVLSSLVFLTILGYLLYINIYSVQYKRDIDLPIGYTLNNYTIMERTGPKCDYDSDCVLPGSYAVQSNCPYKSICLQNTCTVVCPGHE
jgi:hypothetical protein